MFRRGPETMLPLYEGKMIHHFDHRLATFTTTVTCGMPRSKNTGTPDFIVLPRYWVREH